MTAARPPTALLTALGGRDRACAMWMTAPVPRDPRGAGRGVSGAGAAAAGRRQPSGENLHPRLCNATDLFMPEPGTGLEISLGDAGERQGREDAGGPSPRGGLSPRGGCRRNMGHPGDPAWVLTPQPVMPDGAQGAAVLRVVSRAADRHKPPRERQGGG